MGKVCLKAKREREREREKKRYEQGGTKKTPLRGPKRATWAGQLRKEPVEYPK